MFYINPTFRLTEVQVIITFAVILLLSSISGDNFDYTHCCNVYNGYVYGITIYIYITVYDNIYIYCRFVCFLLFVYSWRRSIFYILEASKYFLLVLCHKEKIIYQWLALKLSFSWLKCHVESRRGIN